MINESDTVKDIIILLEEELGHKLPDNGIVAGQSVAEAYYRVNNIDIKTRIKDVDVFTYSYNGFDSYLKNSEQEAMFYITANGKQRMLKRDTSYGRVNLISNENLIIENVVDFGKLNIIKTEKGDFYSPKYTFLHHVIESFDLNCVQIGINLKTKRLYKTDAFNSFVNSNKIEIVNFSSPIASIARLVSKLEISESLHADLNFEIELCIRKLLLIRKKQSLRKSRGSYMSKERLDSFSEKIKSLLNENFNVNTFSARNHNFKTDSEKFFNLVEFSLKDEKINPNILKNTNTIKKSIKSYIDNSSVINRKFLSKIDDDNFVKNSFKFKKENLFTMFDLFPEIYELSLEDIDLFDKYNIFFLKHLKNKKPAIIIDFVKKINEKGLSYLLKLSESDIVKFKNFDDKEILKAFEYVNEIENKSNIHVYDIPENISGLDFLQITNVEDLIECDIDFPINFLYTYKNLINSDIVLFKVSENGFFHGLIGFVCGCKYPTRNFKDNECNFSNSFLLFTKKTNPEIKLFNYNHKLYDIVKNTISNLINKEFKIKKGL